MCSLYIRVREAIAAESSVSFYFMLVNEWIPLSWVFDQNVRVHMWIFSFVLILKEAGRGNRRIGMMAVVIAAADAFFNKRHNIVYNIQFTRYFIQIEFHFLLLHNTLRVHLNHTHWYPSTWIRLIIFIIFVGFCVAFFSLFCFSSFWCVFILCWCCNML